AYLTVTGTGEVIPLFCLWPNHVRTPTTPKEGLRGKLIYGEKGEFSSLNGQDVKGSIVLLDFNCGQHYINPMLLGAQAVIFFDNGKVTRGEAADKFLDVPVDLPRFWVREEDARRLLRVAGSGEEEVIVEGKLAWEEIEARNIYGYLPGTDDRLKDRLIIVEAYYDAISVVPKLAPGAENAAGITALLHVARALKAYGSDSPFLFLATSGHFEGLAGINDFLSRHSRTSRYFRERIPDEQKIDFQLFIGLDLSTHVPSVASFFTGTFYNPGWGTDDYQKNLLAPYAKTFTTYTEDIWGGERERFVDAITPSKRTWKNFLPVPLAFDAESVVFMGREGLTLATPNDVRERVDTPVDQLHYVDIDRLTTQVTTIAGLLVKAGRDEDFFVRSKLELRDRGHRLEGDIRWFDRDENFAIPVVPVGGAVVTYQQPGPNSVGGVRTLITTTTDQHGHFRFDVMRNELSNRVYAFEMDDEGRIISAPDMGEWSLGDFPIEQRYGWWDNRMIEVLFRCRSLSLFELVDPSYLSALDVLTVIGADNTPPQEYGSYAITGQSTKEGKVTPAAVVFARPGSRVKILMSTSLFGIKYLLTNVPEEMVEDPIGSDVLVFDGMTKAEGEGYPVDDGRVLYPAYQTAKDMWAIDDVRMKQLARYGVQNEKLSTLHREAKVALDTATAALDRWEYDRFIAEARRAWGLEARGYPDVKATANDTVRGIIFYFILLIPFSLFCERLLFGFVNIYHRILAFAGIFIAVFVILHVVHPAFKLSTSPYIIFLAFVILAMGSAVLIIVLSKFHHEVRKVKRSSSGLYEADVGRISATAAAVSLGVSNLRKRKLRTGLTVVTLTLLTFTVLSFTSVKTSITFYKISKGNTPPYQGGMVRDRSWKGLQASVLEYLRSAFEEKARVVPRAWYLSQVQGERAYVDFTVAATGQASSANALLGMTADESDVTRVDEILLGGRWFRDGETGVCILPDDMASLVGLSSKDAGQVTVEMLGKGWTVIGIIDSKAFNAMRDMDDEKLTPVDTVSEAVKLTQGISQDPRLVAASPIETFTHLESSNVMILPYNEVIEVGGTLRSVAITPKMKHSPQRTGLGQRVQDELALRRPGVERAQRKTEEGEGGGQWT
ncbi:MAG: hypothetical protein HY709_03700, partial [Candidatus Latescibacteria bacterium]|nr:hypothetical protein [Candidatus Latescibacterota bacterium]